MAISLDKIPTDVLLRAAADRKRELQQSLGPYATVKRTVYCPYCDPQNEHPLGVRERIRHKRVCKKNPNSKKGPQANKATLRNEARKEMKEKKVVPMR